MKINSISGINLQDALVTPPADKPKVEFSKYLAQELQQAEEVKDCLVKVQQELVDLKVLLAQIASIKTNKDVS